MNIFNLLTLSIFLIFSFCSCNQQSQNKEKKFLRISLDSDIVSFDPRISGTRKEQIIMSMLFEGLMRLGPDGKSQPGIAERYQMADDYMSCIFYLRDSHWSNGELVTAHDFANAWRQILEPSFTSNHALAFYTIKNAEAAKKGSLSIDEVGIKVIDDKTLLVEFEHPSPYFVDLTINPLYSPVYLKGSEKEIISNGPFILEKAKLKEGLKMVKNRKYWDEQAIKLDGIMVSCIEDANTSFLMYNQDQLDIFGRPMTAFPMEAIPEYREKGDLHTFPSNGVYWLLFNTEKLPFNSAKIRRAFSYAIDRKELTQNLLQGGEVPTTSILPHLLSLQNEPYFQDANIEEAKKLFKEGLKELGFSSSTLPRIQFVYCSSTSGEKTIAQLIQKQWFKAFGIFVELVGIERAIYLTSAVNGDFDVRSATWYTYMNDPTYNMERFKSRARENVTRWVNADYQKLLDLALNEKDLFARSQYFRRAESVLMEEMPVAPLYHDYYKYIKKERVEGICFSDLGQIDFRWVYIK